MDKITLTRTAAGWMARFSDPKVQDIFGTDTLPTRFTALAAANDVQATIAGLNPGAIVEVK